MWSVAFGSRMGNSCKDEDCYRVYGYGYNLTSQWSFYIASSRVHSWSYHIFKPFLRCMAAVRWIIRLVTAVVLECVISVALGDSTKESHAGHHAVIEGTTASQETRMPRSSGKVFPRVFLYFWQTGSRMYMGKEVQHDRKVTIGSITSTLRMTFTSFPTQGQKILTNTSRVTSHSDWTDRTHRQTDK